MNFPLLTVLLASFVLTQSHPKRYDVIPKDSYKRQILQPIPGYIPVYIQTDEEPIVRSEIKNTSAAEHPQQGDEAKEKTSFKQAEEKPVQKTEEKNSDEIKSESGGEESKNLSGKPEPPVHLPNPNEKQDGGEP